MSDLLDHLQRFIGDRYDLEREIGRGGMATVFVARDRKHSRQVAVKVLHPELAAAVGTERFGREIEIAAKLDHPHILPVHDSGEANGLLFYVMPYVEGESLRDRLERERQLPVDEALRIACEVADGLHHAHEHGVIHRDIKPANIMLSDGHARIADFGVARAIEEAGGQKVTATGLAVGSPVYMSPEQATGEPADRRSDVYSLGCVLYEVLAGEPPFTGPTAQAVLRRKLVEPAHSLKALREGVPRSVESTVAKALATVPADRFATAREFAEALREGRVTGRRRWIGPTLAAAAIVAALAVWQGPDRSSAPGLEGPSRLSSIAVLPFVNRGVGEETAVFVDGVHDDILTQLSKIDDMKLISRTSVMRYRDSEKSIREIGEELGVATVLEGGVQRSGDRVRVTVQLIDARTDDHLWAETYDEELTADNIFAIQTDVARRIAEALQLRLAPGVSERLESPATTDLEAYDLYSQGRFLWNRRTAGDMVAAIELYQRAIAQDSSYALAYTGLADAFITLFSWDFVTWQEVFPQIGAALQRALQLDPLQGESHASRGVFLEYQYNWAGAEREFRRALELAPGYATAHHWYALMLAQTGRFDEALAEIERAAELDPLSPVIATNLGWIHYFARQYEPAIAQLREIIEREPTFTYPMFLLAEAYANLGRCEEANALAGHLAELEPFPSTQIRVAYVYRVCGRTAEAERLVEEHQERADPTRVALVYVAGGDADRAFEWLRRAEETRSAFLTELKVEPRYDSIRGDPRYAELVESLGLE
jgi:serine/threonine-protein kinase